MSLILRAAHTCALAALALSFTGSWLPRYSPWWIVPGGGHVPIYDPLIPFIATVLRFFSSP